MDENGKIDFADKSVTENTRVSYPIEHIEKIVKKVSPVSAGPDAKNVIFLSADAFGDLPPVSVLTPEQTKYYLSGAKAYLVNTGWNGTGKRISIKDTRGIIDAILDGDILTAPTKKIPYFNFEVPTELKGVDSGILDPRDTYANPEEWEAKAKDLAGRFIKNFAKYETNEAGKALVPAGPQL